MFFSSKVEIYYKCKNCGEISLYDTIKGKCVYCGGVVDAYNRTIIQQTVEVYTGSFFPEESNSYRDIFKKELFHKNNFKEKKWTIKK